MVQLTVTPSIVDGLLRLAEARSSRDESNASKTDTAAQESKSDGPASSVATSTAGEPTLERPAVGDPITHGQVLNLWRDLKSEGIDGFSLEGLLRGASVYIPPPPPKPEPSAEYKALMARLRREEEERTYQRMMKQPSRTDNFSQPVATHASRAHAFAEVNRPMRESDNGDDEVTLGDVQKQVMVIFNFLVSIVGVAATIWIAARWWNVTARILLTLAGAILVLVAEVAVYSGYVWKMTEAKASRKEPEEIKEVMHTWVLGEDGSGGKPAEDATILLDTTTPDTDEGIRRRLKGVS
ncbi:hypothetical protein LX32DRAFT_605411 [Colletotrichum zoysiae]|uniref:Endoplasmic reticulum-based factor for assembly of V-ATPase n=1 Tax=Colletotrichum zoysiae TaxID=1216348 RepID=A0AAD9LTX6_9PEZI|nr:hypothetical protein LX32DRAFT_605411 [Colletotrichum zoysiae]